MSILSCLGAPVTVVYSKSLLCRTSPFAVPDHEGHEGAKQVLCNGKGVSHLVPVAESAELLHCRIVGPLRGGCEAGSKVPLNSRSQ